MEVPNPVSALILFKSTELNLIVVLDSAAALSNSHSVSAVAEHCAVRREFIGHTVHLLHTVLVVDEQVDTMYSVSSHTAQASQTVLAVSVQSLFL